jgi:hypothetical protein
MSKTVPYRLWFYTETTDTDTDTDTDTEKEPNINIDYNQDKERQKIIIASSLLILPGQKIPLILLDLC